MGCCTVLRVAEDADFFAAALERGLSAAVMDPDAEELMEVCSAH